MAWQPVSVASDPLMLYCRKGAGSGLRQLAGAFWASQPASVAPPWHRPTHRTAFSQGASVAPTACSKRLRVRAEVFTTDVGNGDLLRAFGEAPRRTLAGTASEAVTSAKNPSEGGLIAGTHHLTTVF